MPKLTWIYRVSPQLILTAEEYKDLDEFTQTAKKIFKSLSGHSQPKMIYEYGGHYFAYIIDNNVCYCTLCDRSYEKNLAFSFLEEIKREFSVQHGAEVRNVQRPYSFIKFDTFIQRTKKLYLDTGSERNLEIVRRQLTDAHQIMTKNVYDLLNRGETVQGVLNRTDELVQDSKNWARSTKDLKNALWWRKWSPIFVVSVTLILSLYLYFFWF